MLPVPDHDDPVAHDSVGHRPAELPWALAGAPELAHEGAGAIEDDDSPAPTAGWSQHNSSATRSW